MNLTLRELMNIHTSMDSGYKPTVVNLVVHNLLMLKDTAQARSYLQKVFKQELYTVMDVSKDMNEWCDLLQLMIRVNIKQFEGIEKPTAFRNYLGNLVNMRMIEFLTYLKSNSKIEDEWLHLKDAARELDCSTKSIRRYLKSGTLRGTRDKAKKILVSRQSVLDFNNSDSI